jgi:5-methylcytosine-specific restriction endonuclease McrA
MHRQSKQCRACLFKEVGRPEHYLERACKKCGKVFIIHKIHVERGGGDYCSIPCARSGSPTRKRERIVLKCPQCGKDFERRPCEIAKGVGTLRFCSRACWYEHNQRERHYLWGGGQAERNQPEYRPWRNAVLKRDWRACRFCNSKERLEVHHILPFRLEKGRRWDVANGITLCSKCHDLLTAKELDYSDLLLAVVQIPFTVWDVSSPEGHDPFTSGELLPTEGPYSSQE